VASIRRHAEAALGIGAAFYRPGMPKRVWVLGAACSMVPDGDVIGFHFGVRYQDFWGASRLYAFLAVCGAFRRAGNGSRVSKRRLPGPKTVVFLFFRGHGKSRSVRRNDQRPDLVSRSFPLCDPLFSPVASYPGFADRSGAFFLER
jgi:hypothetical protein